MHKVVSFFKKLQLGRVLTIFIAGVALFLTTACNSGENLQGARPTNPPVQMGGNNNPHAMGGDGYTNYQMSTDPSVNRTGSSSTPKLEGDRADLMNFSQLIASSGVQGNASDLLYPGSSATDKVEPDIGARGEAIDPTEATRIPAKPQPVLNRANPKEQILEKIGEQFKEASEFINDMGENAAQYPELQSNPAMGK